MSDLFSGFGRDGWRESKHEDFGLFGDCFSGLEDVRKRHTMIHGMLIFVFVL